MTADQRAAKTLERFLKEIGPSRAVESFLSEHGNVRTKCAYAMELVEYKRWLTDRGIKFGWDELPKDNLRCVYESRPIDVEAKRTHMDWLKTYLNVYMMGKGYSLSKRKIASVAIREFYEANDSPLFGHLKEAEGKEAASPPPLEPDDIRKVLLAMSGRFRMPLLIEWQSSIEINRVIDMDWSFALKDGVASPVKVSLFGRKRHKKPYSTFLGAESYALLKSYARVMPSYEAVCDNFHSAVRRLSASGELKNPDMGSWHTHYLRHSFKTEAEHAEAKSGIIEYFMGHKGGIKWVYDHRDEIHPEDYEKEYRKIEPHVSLHPNEATIRESYAEREQSLLKRVTSLEQRLERMVSGQP